uniref:Uncharacterized protein n=1 Tax=Solanum lycopersicum TaxID=4081 RepID=K4AW43_SOLLC
MFKMLWLLFAVLWLMELVGCVTCHLTGAVINSSLPVGFWTYEFRQIVVLL